MQPLSKNLLLKNHPDLSFNMRAKLINWLFEVTLHFKLQRETMYSTQMILDQFLTNCKSPQPRNNLQLIGLAALLISSKLEEVLPPNLINLSQICDKIYKESEISKMELEICTCLKWNLTPINILSWTRFYYEGINVKDNYSVDAKSYHSFPYTSGILFKIEYITDFIIHSPDFLNFKPSALSAAIFSFIAPNNLTFEKCTGYKIDDLMEEISFFKSWIELLAIEDISRESSTLKLLHSAGQISYCDPKILPILSDSEFESLVNFNRIALNLILKRIKQG